MLSKKLKKKYFRCILDIIKIKKHIKTMDMNTFANTNNTPIIQSGLLANVRNFLGLNTSKLNQPKPKMNYGDKIHKLINYIRSEHRKPINCDSCNFLPTIEAYVPSNVNLIGMSLELYDTLKVKTNFKVKESPDDQQKVVRTMNKNTVSNERPTGNFLQQFNDSMEKKITNHVEITIPELTKPTKPMEIGIFSDQEFEHAFKDIEIDKIDPLGINERILTNVNELTKRFIINKFNELYKNPKIFAGETSFGRLSFLYKTAKGGPTDKLDSFRQIVCIPKIISAFQRMLTNRLIDYLNANNYIDTTIQKGVMPGTKFGIPEHIYKVKSILKQSYNTRQPAYILFIDITNAFGSINRELLYDIMKKYHVPQEFIDYILEFYKSFEFYTDEDDIDTLRPWNNGLIQGSSLSPILFVMAMNFIISHLNNKYAKTHGFKFNADCVNLFTGYIDDVCISCDSYEHLNEVYTELKKLYNDLGLEINPSKSGFMSINDPNKNQFLDTIPLVKDYKYLGEYIVDNASPDMPFSDFMKGLYKKMYKLEKAQIDNKPIPQTIKAKIFVKVIWPWIIRKGIALYDASDKNKENAITFITKFTTDWNVINDITVNTVFKNIKSLLGDSNDTVVENILSNDNSNYVKDHAYIYNGLLKKYTNDLQNFGYANQYDEDLIGKLIDPNMEYIDQQIEEELKAIRV